MKVGSMVLLFCLDSLARKSNCSLIFSTVSFWFAMTLSADENSPEQTSDITSMAVCFWPLTTMLEYLPLTLLTS